MTEKGSCLKLFQATDQASCDNREPASIPRAAGRAAGKRRWVPPVIEIFHPSPGLPRDVIREWSGEDPHDLDA